MDGPHPVSVEDEASPGSTALGRRVYPFWFRVVGLRVWGLGFRVLGHPVLLFPLHLGLEVPLSRKEPFKSNTKNRLTVETEAAFSPDGNACGHPRTSACHAVGCKDVCGFSGVVRADARVQRGATPITPLRFKAP